MTNRSTYLAYIQDAFANDRDRLSEELQRWRAQFEAWGAASGGANAALFGYGPPAWPTALAAVAAFLYQQNGDAALATQARDILLAHREWTRAMPAEIAATRPEYADGVPPLEPVFQPLVFIPACERIRSTLSTTEYAALAEMVAETFHMVQRFPEWGGHNRAMLRAAGLALAARAFPDHREAPVWAALSDELAEESWGRWSLEDAILYQPHWLRSLFLYAETRGLSRARDITQLLQPRFYLKAAVQLLTPLGTLPDFGDSHWNPSPWEWLQCLEWGARVYGDAAMKWAAGRIWANLQASQPASAQPGVGGAVWLMGAWAWCDDDVPAREPAADATPDALDDLVMKKIVFRTGWDEQATYACLNYRDEGDYGRVARDYLRTTLAVSAEKMHHGHADENSFALLVSRGNVLLHESGYRERPPDGIYRADIYQNRMVWRNEIQPAGTSAVDFLSDNGRYHPVRSERLYWTRLGDAEISRTRVTDDARGIMSDRTVFFLAALDCFVVIDSAQALRAGPFTLSALWWTTDVLAQGPAQGHAWCDTQIRQVQTWQNRRDRALLLAFPEAEGATTQVETYRRSFQQEMLIARSWRGHLRAGDTVSLASVLWAHDAAEDVTARGAAITGLPVAPAQRGAGVAIEWAGERHTFGTLHDLTSGWVKPDIRPRYTAGQGQTAYGLLVTDAAFVYCREAIDPPGDRPVWAGFINGTSLRYGGRVLYEGQPHAMFQEDASALNGIPARFRWMGDLRV